MFFEEMTIEQRVATIVQDARALNDARDNSLMVCLSQNRAMDKWFALVLMPMKERPNVLVRSNGDYKTIGGAINALKRNLELRLHVEDGARETTKYTNDRIEKEGSRFTWGPGDMTQVSPAPQGRHPNISSMYILMRHDAKKHNHEYLYDYAIIVDTVQADPAHEADAVDVVEVSGHDLDKATYNARYQLNRLGSGLETVGDDNLYATLEDARTRALEISASLVELHRKRG